MRPRTIPYRGRHGAMAVEAIFLETGRPAIAPKGGFLRNRASNGTAGSQEAKTPLQLYSG